MMGASDKRRQSQHGCGVVYRQPCAVSLGTAGNKRVAEDAGKSQQRMWKIALCRDHPRIPYPIYGGTIAIETSLYGDGGPMARSFIKLWYDRRNSHVWPHSMPPFHQLRIPPPSRKRRKKKSKKVGQVQGEHPMLNPSQKMMNLVHSGVAYQPRQQYIRRYTHALPRTSSLLDFPPSYLMRGMGPMAAPRSR